MRRIGVSVVVLGLTLGSGLQALAGSSAVQRRPHYNSLFACRGILVEEHFGASNVEEQLEEVTLICYESPDRARWILQARESCAPPESPMQPKPEDICGERNDTVQVQTHYPRHQIDRVTRQQPFRHSYRLQNGLIGQFCNLNLKGGYWACQQVTPFKEKRFFTIAFHTWQFGLDRLSRILPAGYVSDYYGYYGIVQQQ
ncbi:MAG: hypothetical protein NZL92_11910 [Gloeomargarita sp. SKYG116]|nr:hypothetical protein [Gloeomargarita sp. SKYG116]MCS7227180.1 hypothetical protein [Gloeomargarita sp. SKYB31]MDW8402385.1 hypothetical protein [Gloeomargarita sp. SKYGB_i_bin116]